MVGNDIIDIELAKTQSNWQRPRYLDKIFTPKEQELIERSEEPHTMVWRLWSMKEAAYKLYIQLHPARFYNPKAFECVLRHKGMVIYGTFKCYVNTKITSNYIISEALFRRQKISSEIIWLNITSSKSQSQILKDQLLSVASKQLRCDKKELSFVKHAYGIPTIQYKTKAFNVSLSHHGRFGTIAFAQ